MSSVTVRSGRPLLKWAGGKRQLLPELRRFYPKTFARYLEPFFGSGAVFFDLYRSGALEGHDVTLIDSNADLIGCYEQVRDDPDQVTDVLEQLEHERSGDARAHYYRVRDELFNPAREARRSADGLISYTAELAAMFIYLNRTGFNGLFRVNRRGAFNVPAGRYDKPRIADRDRLHEVARALNARRVRLVFGSFTLAESLAGRRDFLYVDPPYAPMSPTASFTSYTSTPFGPTEQAELQSLSLTLARRGCHLLLSNSTAPVIRDLYDKNDEARRVGLRAYRVGARRAISSKGTGRGPIDEYLITNIKRAE